MTCTQRKSTRTLEVHYCNHGYPCFATQIMNRIKECIEGRLGADALDQERGKTNHMLDNKHTHIGIGVHVVDDRLRYAEVSQCGVGCKVTWG